MEMLMKTLDEEKKRIKEQMQDEMKKHSNQTRDMIAANMREAVKQRKEFSKNNKELQDRIEEMQEHERENMKIIKNLSEKAAEKEKKTQERLQRLKDETHADKEAMLKEANDSHENEMAKQQRKWQEKLDKVSEDAQKGKRGIASTNQKQRVEYVKDLHARIEGTRQAQEKVEEPGALKTFCNVVSGIAPVIGAAFSIAAPPLAPIAGPVGAAVGAVAGLVSKCSVM